MTRPFAPRLGAAFRDEHGRRSARLLRRCAGRIGSSPHLFAAVVSLILILAVFPDVVFRGASLRLTDQIEGAYQGLKLLSVYPPAPHRQWWHGYYDTGGATWQSEPMMEFMRHNVWTLDSPYWNPFSSAGALGPETLVDQKFSIVTLAYAALGGGTLVYNAVMVAFLWLGTFFIVLIARAK